jgi:hypothetical protein
MADPVANAGRQSAGKRPCWPVVPRPRAGWSAGTLTTTATSCAILGRVPAHA